MLGYRIPSIILKIHTQIHQATKESLTPYWSWETSRSKRISNWLDARRTHTQVQPGHELHNPQDGIRIQPEQQLIQDDGALHTSTLNPKDLPSSKAEQDRFAGWHGRNSMQEVELKAWIEQRSTMPEHVMAGLTSSDHPSTFLDPEGPTHPSPKHLASHLASGVAISYKTSAFSWRGTTFAQYHIVCVNRGGTSMMCQSPQFLFLCHVLSHPPNSNPWTLFTILCSHTYSHLSPSVLIL